MTPGRALDRSTTTGSLDWRAPVTLVGLAVFDVLLGAFAPHAPSRVVSAFADVALGCSVAGLLYMVARRKLPPISAKHARAFAVLGVVLLLAGAMISFGTFKSEGVWPGVQAAGPNVIAALWPLCLAFLAPRLAGPEEASLEAGRDM